MFKNKYLINLILPLFVEQFLLMFVGIAIGMSMDLVFRGIIFIRRLHSQKWTKFQLI